MGEGHYQPCALPREASLPVSEPKSFNGPSPANATHSSASPLWARHRTIPIPAHLTDLPSAQVFASIPSPYPRRGQARVKSAGEVFFYKGRRPIE
jgi:hypothetical protein